MIHGIISVLIVLIVFIIYGEIKKWQIQRKLTGFSTPWQLPILGVAGRFINKSNDQFVDMLNEFVAEVGKTPIQAWFGPLLAVIVAEPEDMQIILSSDDCLNKPYFYEHMKCKTSIVATRREIWKPQRRALNAIFNFKMLQNYVPLLNSKAHVLVQQFGAFVGQPGDLYRTIFIGMIDMIFLTTMGAEQHLQIRERGSYFYNLSKMMMSNIQYRMSRIWLRWDFTYSLSKVYRDEQPWEARGQGYLEEMIEEKLNEFEQMRLKGVDYLADAEANNTTNLLEKCLILERNGMFTRTNTIDQLRVVIFAGIDTSSITIFGTLLMLAIHQECQAAAVAELRSIFDTADADVTNDDLKNLVYLERCIRETMRLLPPAPVVARITSADIKLPSGTIPKGTITVLDIMHLHRNAKVWGPTVNEFDPDRFLPENVAKRPPYSYIPFSAGQRNCIGMKYALVSAKITLAHLLRQYKFTTALKINDIRMKMHLILEIMNENAITIETRAF